MLKKILLALGISIAAGASVSGAYAQGFDHRDGRRAEHHERHRGEHGDRGHQRHGGSHHRGFEHHGRR